MKTKTQKSALVQAFIENKHLTAITAFKLTGSMKLSTRVPEFEQMGLKFKKTPIQFKTKYGTSGRYNEYALVNKSDAKKLLKELKKGNK
jgi:hypothetical protein